MIRFPSSSAVRFSEAGNPEKGRDLRTTASDVEVGWRPSRLKFLSCLGELWNDEL